MSLREKKKQSTRAKLLEAARAAFADLGYKAAKTSDIAKAVGVAEGTLFNYFPTKAELFLAAMLPAEEPVVPADAAVEPDPARWADAAAAVVDAGLRGLAGMEKRLQREFFALFYGAPPAEGDAVRAGLAAFDRGLAERIGAWFAKQADARADELRAFDAALATECVCGLALANYSVYLMEDAMTYEEMLKNLRRQIEFALAGHLTPSR